MSSVLDNAEIRSSVMPITVEQYRSMGASGLISERTELIQGVIVRKMNKSPLHGWTLRRLRSLIEPQIPSGFYLRQEEPLSFSDSEPEPDLAIVRGDQMQHREEHPTTAELVIEVAVSTKELDRAKVPLYATAGVLAGPAQRVSFGAIRCSSRRSIWTSFRRALR